MKKKVADTIEDSISAAERYLLSPSTCRKCHTALHPQSKVVEASDIPSVWFQRARFDHTSHRALACQVCHQDVEASTKSAKVSLPNMDVCLNCHAPTKVAGAQVLGGARFDCVECHRYHQGDEPLHGRGSPKRRPAGAATNDLQKFLKGNTR